MESSLQSHPGNDGPLEQRLFRYANKYQGHPPRGLKAVMDCFCEVACGEYSTTVFTKRRLTRMLVGSCKAPAILMCALTHCRSSSQRVHLTNRGGSLSTIITWPSQVVIEPESSTIQICLATVRLWSTMAMIKPVDGGVRRFFDELFRQTGVNES
jgi:hypothetical protein